VTLALCLFGAVMIFSASAVTAEQQYGHSYIFLVRQPHGSSSAFGMFALMKTTIGVCANPLSSIRSLRRLALARGTFFLDKSMPRSPGSNSAGGHPTVGTGELATILIWRGFWITGAATRPAWKFQRKISGDDLPAAAPILVFVALILLQPDLGTSIDILVVAAHSFRWSLSWKWLAVGSLERFHRVLLITQVAYRQARLTAFLHPDSDPQGAGFIASIAHCRRSGGFTGVGLMESKQKLFYFA